QNEWPLYLIIVEIGDIPISHDREFAIDRQYVNG
ncbi:hypothetical protein EVA_08640, partial [gut metagenome]